MGFLIGQTRKARQRGAAIVETVIGFSVLVVLIFGVVETSLFYHDHEILYNVTREAARRLAVGDTGAVAKSYALSWSNNPAFTANTVAFTLQQSGTGNNSDWTTVSDASQAKIGNLVRVKTTYLHHQTTVFFGSSYTFPATAIMRVDNGASS